MRKYSYVDGDQHLEIAPEAWAPFVEARFRDQTPRTVKLPDGGDAWQMPGSNKLVPAGLNLSAGLARGMHWERLKTSGISYADNPPGTGNGEHHLKEMDVDGVDAAVLYPAVFGQRTLDEGAIGRDAYIALVRGYNDWQSKEYCAADYDRLLGCGLLPTTGVDAAVAELYRLAKMPGIRTVALHQWPNGGPAPAPGVDDRFWAAAVETGMPLSVHITFGGGKAADLPPKDAPAGNWIPINGLLTRVDANGSSYTAMQLITSGVFDRFPTLKFAYAETGASWVPFFSEAADSNYERHRWHANLRLENPPSYYIKQHFIWGIQDDFAAIRIRHEIGVDRIMWSTDFPHAASDWPVSQPLVAKMFGGVPEEEKSAICAGNAIKFFRLNGA